MQVGVVPLCGLHQFRSVGRVADDIVVRLEQALYFFQHAGVIVGEQDAIAVFWAHNRPLL